jgi:hypothetical protein
LSNTKIVLNRRKGGKKGRGMRREAEGGRGEEKVKSSEFGERTKGGKKRSLLSVRRKNKRKEQVKSVEFGKNPKGRKGQSREGKRLEGEN